MLQHICASHSYATLADFFWDHVILLEWSCAFASDQGPPQLWKIQEEKERLDSVVNEKLVYSALWMNVRRRVRTPCSIYMTVLTELKNCWFFHAFMIYCTLPLLAKVLQSWIRTALHVKYCFLRVTKVFSDIHVLDFGMWSFCPRHGGGCKVCFEGSLRTVSLVSKPAVEV
jgi:hypothetical protein